MNKLHELLAVKPSKEGEATNIINSHASTFKGNHALFQGRKKVFNPTTGSDNDDLSEQVREEVPLTTTVAKEFKFCLDKFGETVDLLATIDRANTLAKADVVVGGEVMFKDVPATFLVHLEKRLNQILLLVKNIPTADPVKGFAPDRSLGENVLAARPVTRDSTNKVEEWVTVVEPTDKHPAQIKLMTKDVKIGELTTFEWSGLPTTAQKSNLILRATELRDAIVTARARANCHEVKQEKIFDKVTNYLMKAFD